MLGLYSVALGYTLSISDRVLRPSSTRPCVGCTKRTTVAESGPILWRRHRRFFRRWKRRAARKKWRSHGITGSDGGEIDHIELFGHPTVPGADSKNFVLCPGKAYDRSPCGTGTSAKLACLYADGKLRPGQTWRQESIVGSVFEGTVTVVDGKIYPEITGSAFVNAEADLILDERDPFCYGIRGS